MGKSKKTKIEPPAPPTQQQFMGTQVKQDGQTVANISRGSDGRLYTDITTPTAQKAVQDYNTSALYTPGQNIYRTVSGTPTLDEAKAKTGYQNYLKNASMQTQGRINFKNYNPWPILGNVNRYTPVESYDSWLSKNRDNYMYTPTTQELVGTTPASGLNVDLNNYVQSQGNLASEARTKLGGLNTQITDAINNANVVDPAFQQQLNDNMAARMRLGSDSYDQQYNDNTLALANNMAKRFGSLNSSAYQATQGRLDDSYNKGMADLIDRNLLARTAEQNNLAALKQQNIQNLTNDRGYYSNINNNYGNQLGSALNYFSGNSYTQPNMPSAALQAVSADQQQNALNNSANNAYYQNYLGYANAQNQANQSKPWWQSAIQAGLGLIL